MVRQRRRGRARRARPSLAPRLGLRLRRVAGHGLRDGVADRRRRRRRHSSGPDQRAVCSLEQRRGRQRGRSRLTATGRRPGERPRRRPPGTRRARSTGARPWPTAAAAQGDGLRAVPRASAARRPPLRRRRHARRLRVLDQALEHRARADRHAVDRPHRDAAIVLDGRRPVVVPARTGRVLDRAGRRCAIVLGASRLSTAHRPVPLPVALEPTRDAPPRSRSPPSPRCAGPVRSRCTLRSARRAVRGCSRRQLAPLLELPHGGRRALAIGGPARRPVLQATRRAGRHAAAQRDFAVVAGRARRSCPARPGRALDVAADRREPPRRRALADPAASPTVVVDVAAQPARSTAQAQAMGITARIGSYTTIYGGDPNRIHNVQLVAHLIDGTLIAPGATFSFNGTTGDRNAAKGFLEAPVIINGELTTGLGGGVCQVSTTVFNAAYEAGLTITARTNHALYISHYPQGRDATVNYPDVDLKFVNDTDHWLLLRTFVGSYSLDRQPLRHADPPARRRRDAPARRRPARRRSKTTDPTLFKGETVVEETGVAVALDERAPASSTTPNGKLLYDNTGTRPTGRSRRSSASGRSRSRSRRRAPASPRRAGAEPGRPAAGRTAPRSRSPRRASRDARRPERHRVDAGVARPARRRRSSPSALDRVLVAEARAAQRRRSARGRRGGRRSGRAR